jgi:hypothetical protein
MMSETRTCGFHASDAETYYVAPDGRAWIVQSGDDLGTTDPVEIDPVRIPADAQPVDGLLTPGEAIEHCRRIERVSGLSLVELTEEG